MVDADLADLIDYDAEFVSVLMLQDVIEKGRLSGPEEPGEDRCGNWL